MYIVAIGKNTVWVKNIDFSFYAKKGNDVKIMFHEYIL